MSGGCRFSDRLHLSAWHSTEMSRHLLLTDSTA